MIAFWVRQQSRCSAAARCDPLQPAGCISEALSCCEGPGVHCPFDRHHMSAAGGDWSCSTGSARTLPPHGPKERVGEREREREGEIEWAWRSPRKVCVSITKHFRGRQQSRSGKMTFSVCNSTSLAYFGLLCGCLLCTAWQQINPSPQQSQACMREFFNIHFSTWWFVIQFYISLPNLSHIHPRHSFHSSDSFNRSLFLTQIFCLS